MTAMLTAQLLVSLIKCGVAWYVNEVDWRAPTM